MPVSPIMQCPAASFSIFTEPGRAAWQLSCAFFCTSYVRRSRFEFFIRRSYKYALPFVSSYTAPSIAIVAVTLCKHDQKFRHCFVWWELLTYGPLLVLGLSQLIDALLHETFPLKNMTRQWVVAPGRLPMPPPTSTTMSFERPQRKGCTFHVKRDFNLEEFFKSWPHIWLFAVKHSLQHSSLISQAAIAHF